MGNTEERNLKATIVDVAKLAGVSMATVSRVVNSNYPVREKTRRRVQEAIEELEYVPNVQARELNLQQSTIIGVVVPSLYNMFFAEVIDGIESCVRQDGYSLLLNCAKNDPDQEMECINTLLTRNVSGIIVISPNTQGIEEEFYVQMVKRAPLVFINGYRQVPGVSYVMNDESRGTRQALTYLMNLGHRRILFVRGKNSDSYEIKEKTYREIMQEKGLFSEDCIIRIDAGNSLDTVDVATDRLLQVIASSDITAVFCCNDLMGAGAIKACKRLGRRVPEDISVIGYDNIALSRFIEPRLTTMDQNMFHLGESAATLLLEKIHGGENKQIMLDNVLVERESTARCAR